MSTDLLLLSQTSQTYSLYSWGENIAGQLGTNPHYFGYTQLTTGALATETFVQVESCGGGHFALTDGGDLYGWGMSQYLGTNDFATFVYYTTPQLILQDVAQFSIANGASVNDTTFLAMAVKTDGTLWFTGKAGSSGSWGASSYTYSTDWNIWKQSNNAGTTCEKISVSKSVFGANSQWAILLKTDGTVWAIGDNIYGQLGQGNTTDSFSSFVQVKGVGGAGFLTSISDISAGGYTGYAVTSSGGVYGWGYNQQGECGDGTSGTNRTTPVQVKYFATLGGATVSTATKVFAFQFGAYITITPGTGPAAYQSKTNFYGWGSNTTTAYELSGYWYGTTATGAVPIFTAYSSTGSVLPDPLTITSVSGSIYATQAAITSGGLLLMWGGAYRSAWGQSAESYPYTYGAQQYPTAVDAATNWSFLPEVQASTNYFDGTRYVSFAYAGKAAGTVYGTGANSQGSFAIFNKTSTPAIVGTPRQWSTATSGGGTTLYTDNQQELYGSGANNLYQLGQSTTYPYYFEPYKLTTGQWTAVATNGWSSAAISGATELYAWGQNSAGQLGNGSTTQVTTITKVTRYVGGLPTSGATQVHIGGSSSSSYTAALYDNGKVYTAGDNLFRQLGNGTTTDSSTFGPVQDYRLYDLQNVEQIWGGYYHTFCKLSVGDPASGDNDIFVWGSNTYGEHGVGNTSTVTRAQPSGAYDPSKEILDIACGLNFSIVLYADGTVKACGRNDFGQLGNGTTTSPVTAFQPVRNSTDTADLTGVVAIGALVYSGVAVLANGDVYVWGANSWALVNSTGNTADPYTGYLVPNDDTAYFTLPTLVGNVTNVVDFPNMATSQSSAFLLRDA